MNQQISIQNAKVGYVNNNTLIRIPDLQLKGGEFVGLVGVNGSGKSTLIRSIANFQDLQEGDIKINGNSIKQLSASEMAKYISVVLTDKLIVGYATVFDMVATGRFPYISAFKKLNSEDKQKIKDALELVGMWQKAKQPFDQLSDGQQQKVILAKCLAQETPFILLDEPMAFLDLPSKMELSYILHDLAKNQNKGIIISTHDLDLAMHTCDKMWLVHQQKMVSGAPEDMAVSGLLSDVFDTDSVAFNKQTGHFEFGVKNQGEVMINQLNEMELFWLKKALSRIGFKVVEKADIVIEKTDHVWRVNNGKAVSEVKNFTELITCLV